MDCILRHAGTPHSQEAPKITKVVEDGHISKVSSVLKSLARDWSVEGREERDMAYGPMIDKVVKYLPLSAETKVKPKICVPGAGKKQWVASKFGANLSKPIAVQVLVDLPTSLQN